MRIIDVDTDKAGYFRQKQQMKCEARAKRRKEREELLSVIGYRLTEEERNEVRRTIKIVNSL